PYRTAIDLAGPAFRCTCPSRKFPCKHALGLFLLLVEREASFTGAPAPDWVAEWLAGRTRRAQARAEPPDEGRKTQDARRKTQDEGSGLPSSPALRPSSVAQRRARTAAGVEELDLWLADLIRHGLADAQSRPAAFWQTPAARLVDAQAPGLARLLREA